MGTRRPYPATDRRAAFRRLEVFVRPTVRVELDPSHKRPVGTAAQANPYWNGCSQKWHDCSRLESQSLRTSRPHSHRRIFFSVKSNMLMSEKMCSKTMGEFTAYTLLGRLPFFSCLLPIFTTAPLSCHDCTTVLPRLHLLRP